MLESTNRLDLGEAPPSPLEEVDPKSLDEFFARLDTEMKLGNVPKPSDRKWVIDFYQTQRLKILEDERMAAVKEPKKPRPKTIKAALQEFSIL